MADERAPFLSRWSQRKAAVREGVAVAETVAAPALDEASPAATGVLKIEDATPAELPVAPPPEPRPEPPPTLEEAAALTPASDFTRFVARDVPPEVKNAALKKLFSDPQFNVMDRLDTYIDDYNTPDPLPASWLRKMTQAAALGLFDDEVEPKPAAADDSALAPSLAPSTTASASDEAPTAALSAPESAPAPCDENTDLRLQPDDAAGCAGPEGGVGQDAGREH